MVITWKFTWKEQTESCVEKGLEGQTAESEGCLMNRYVPIPREIHSRTFQGRQYQRIFAD